MNDDGTVMLWATTSTSSASGDNGADPNRVVLITDRVSATKMTGEVPRETFTTIAGPTYGTAYRGVAYVCGTRRSSQGGLPYRRFPLLEPRGREPLRSRRKVAAAADAPTQGACRGTHSEL